MENNGVFQALIIDDEVDICILLSHILKNKKIECKQVNSLTDAKEILNDFRPQIVFLDNHLPDGLGVEFVSYVKSVSPGSKIVIVTAHDLELIREKALSDGAFDFVSKPFTVDKIHIVLEKIFECI